MDLSKIRDEELIEKIRNNEKHTSNFVEELNERHSGIYYKTVNYFHESFKNYNVDIKNVYDDKLYVLYDSVKTFNPDKNVKFSTYFCDRTKFYCFKKIKERSDIKEISVDNIVNYDAPYEDLEITKKAQENCLKIVMEEIKKLGDKRAYNIFKARYIDCGNKLTPWKKVGEKTENLKFKKGKMSYQGCLNIHNSIIQKIRKNVISKLEEI